MPGLTTFSTVRKIEVLEHILKLCARRWLVGHSDRLRKHFYDEKAGRHAVLREELIRMKADVGKHICTTVIAPQCRAVCQSMQKKLPRELRDIVAVYIQLARFDSTRAYVNRVSP